MDLTAEDRKALAQQILTNPLTDEIFDGIERDAIEALVRAKTEQDRVEAQWRVRAARSFRQDCEQMLRNTHGRKGAIA